MLAPPQAQNGFAPQNPAKEYIYAGGRLVATEEPVGLNAPSDLMFVATSTCAVSAHGYLNWNDNSDGETGFVVEARTFSNGVWSAWVQKEAIGANVTNSGTLSVKIRTEFRVKAVSASAGSSYTNTVTALGSTMCEASCTPPTSLIVSEFRLRGAAGGRDEFIEFYNRSDSAITVCTADTSGGWTLAARKADGTSASPVFTIPNSTTIPARGHYLAVNASPDVGYSLTSHPAGSGTTATGDITYATDIEDNSGIALFKTSNPANFTTANRLDAAGFGGPAGAIPDLYREGAGLAQIGTQNSDYTLARRVNAGSGWVPQDTANNSSDFWFLSTDGGVYGGVQSVLGAPGPENLSSPVRRDANIPVALLDPTISSSQPPNRVRDLTSDPANNSTFGTLSVRRRVTNNTGGNVTRLRFRVLDITTFPVPSGTADLRARSSGAIQVTVQGSPVTVHGTTVEQPPAQPTGGGFNTAMSVGTVSLAQPLAAGASVNVQFLLGLQSTGSFRFIISVEALP